MGIVLRWSPTIPFTLLGLFFGQFLPYRNGHSHNAMESVEHHVIIPVIVAILVAIVMVLSEWSSLRLEQLENESTDELGTLKWRQMSDIKATERWNTFGFEVIYAKDIAVWAIPYWSVVLPLTVTSASLMLSKPKPRINPVPPNA